jgi:hypothetical protein
MAGCSAAEKMKEDKKGRAKLFENGPDNCFYLNRYCKYINFM